MKKSKQENKEQTLTPREAAKIFIRPYLDKGDTLSLHPHFHASIETEDYSVQIDGEDVVLVTKLYGTKINERFSLLDIMREIIMTHSENLIQRTEKSSPKEEYLKKELKIKELLIRLKVKLKTHKKDFAKHPTNWGYVGDLGHIIEVLEEII